MWPSKIRRSITPPEKLRPLFRPSVRLGAIFGITLLVVALCDSEAKAETPLAKLHPVTEVGGTIEREFFGRVVAKETVDISFQVGGQVVAFPVSEGSIVPKGALIAQLDQEPFELALDEALTQQRQAQRTLERLEKLRGSTVSQVSVDDARTQVELAEIGVRNAERSLRLATLHAPFDTLISSRLVAALTTIGAGTPVVRLHDMSELRIEIDVPEVLFQRAGRDPSLTLLAEFPTSARTYPLELREFNAETSQIGQTYKITLGLEVPEDIIVLPGASAKVLASLAQDGSRIEIPASSVVFTADGAPQVVVFDPAGAAEGTVRRVDVTLGATANGGVSVTSGLEAGQEIVASGAARLADGATVRRFTGFAK